MLSDSQLYRLNYQHHTISELVKPFTEEQLRIPVNPGKWSVLENVAHLAAYQPVFLERLAVIQQTEAPQFERYVADTDPAFIKMASNPIHEILEHLPLNREYIINELGSMDESRLQRVGIHPRYGRMDVPAWTEFFLLHEAHHLFTIFMLTAELRKRQV